MMSVLGLNDEYSSVFKVIRPDRWIVLGDEALRIGDSKISKNLASQIVRYLFVPWDRRSLSVCRVPPPGVIPTFTDKLTSLID